MIDQAPAASALVMSPENLIPPSAISGTPCRCAARAHIAIAVTCGTPMPVTTRVVQIDPGPMPTLTASTPIFIRSSAPSSVATLPATMSTPANVFLSARTVSMTPDEWPWAVSTTRTSTRASTSARARSISSGPTPTAAPTRSLPRASLQACGYLITFWMSLTVISPFR